MSGGLTVVVDYGLCNIDSMARALEECGARRVECTGDPRAVHRADRIVLPGVGSFATAMRSLTDLGLAEAIQEVSIAENIPILGVCLGMQLMATTGTEGAATGPIDGLGLIRGSVICLTPMTVDERIPHIGWNEVVPKEDAVLFKEIPINADFYFVHSYHMKLIDETDEAARTPYCGGFTSAVQNAGRTVFGTQFHPEKSQRHGFRVLKNFLAV